MMFPTPAINEFLDDCKHLLNKQGKGGKVTGKYNYSRGANY